MALHRDIYWVGRQWAVTGYGIQACNQKQRGQFDIEGARLWEDGVLERIRAENWLNSEDFDKALEVARKHFPEPPRKTRPPEARVLGLVKTVSIESGRNDAASKDRVVQEAGSQELRPREPSPNDGPAERPKPVVRKFDMRIERWPARLVPLWRVRIHRQ